jgi:hypothetical protein
MNFFERALPLQTLLHWFVIRRWLYRYGAKFPTGFVPWRILRDVRDYRELLRAEARILNPYYFYVVLMWFNFLLGLTLALYYLWLHTSVQDSGPGGLPLS